jgi:hypothetical protein
MITVLICTGGILWLTTCAAIVAALHWARKRRDHGDAAAASHPEAGSPPPPGTTRPPLPPVTGGHGGLAKRIDELLCGRTIITDFAAGRREIIPGNCLSCTPPADLDDELRRLTS